MNLVTQAFPGVDFASRVQNYENVEAHADAQRMGCDVTELKYDGWWGRLVVEREVGKVYSRQGQLKHEAKIEMPNCVVIGEFLKGTQRVVSGTEGKSDFLMAFDCLEWDGSLVADRKWTRRKRVVNSMQQYTDGGQWVCPVESYGIEDAGELWNRHVDNGNAEGLVYRKSTDPYVGSTLYRRKKQFTVDYVVTGVYEGQGKHKGRLGGVTAGLFVNGKLKEKVKVGGGFNDSEREAIWQSPRLYIGRVLEVTGWQVFESGAVRHPNAVRGEDGLLRWRDDKRPEHCTWPS
jgi:ATP-dependent DNA ligase